MRFRSLTAGLAALAGLIGMAGCGDAVTLGRDDAAATHPLDDTTSASGDATVDASPDTAPAPLEIRAVEPQTGDVAGGVDIMITGRGFRAGVQVYFDQTPVSDVVVIGPTIVIVRLPPHPAAVVDVSVAHHDHLGGAPEVLPGAFRYVGVLQIDRLEPSAGSIDGGELVTVHGRGFTADSRAFVAGRPLIGQARADDTTITGVAPPGRWGPADAHVVGLNGTALLSDGYFYGAPPRVDRLSPIVGAPGVEVVLEGSALSDDSQVFFDELPAEVSASAVEGGRLLVVAPELAPGALVDVRVQTAWGLDVWPDAFATPDPTRDPLVLACTHLAPAHGPAAGGNTLEIACRGLAYPGLTVSIGGEPATVLEKDIAGQRLIVRAPAGSGDAIVKVASAVAQSTVPMSYHFDAAASVAVDSVTPALGPVAGGTSLTIRGKGFGPGAVVQIGALVATGVHVIDATTLEAVTPPGAPGNADVVVRHSGEVARLADGFAYHGDRLALDLVTPPTAARAGGTYMRVYGDHFSDATEVTIGGLPCPIIARVSPGELHVRSPHIDVGTYDAVVSDGGASVTLARALTVFDPRSGYGGTWGAVIDETLNVTVWGSGGYGAVAGAYVIVGNDASTPWQGVTDENGQLTISGPALRGPVAVTASREAFTSYSVLEFDATNLTIILQQNPTPPPPQQGNGTGEPQLPPPTARINGTVTGLGKYVVAPPGSCAPVAIADTDFCRPCGEAASVPQCGAGFACVDTGPEGEHCLSDCAVDAECPTGYRCGATAAGTRCLPSVGVPAAYCNVSSTSLFGYEYPIQSSGWVDAEGHYSIDSMRIGEVAIYCVAGYRDDLGAFTPTIMGVRRHLFAGSGETFDDIDIALEYPLERSFRLRLMDPPIWSTGLMAPQIVVSLDLGADGVLPMSRTLLPAGDLTWIAARELGALSGDLYDAQYFFYTTLAPDVPNTYQPRAYNLVQNVRRVVEDRFPVRDVDGRWRLEGLQIERDVHAVWGAPDGSRAYAVGEGGLILAWFTAANRWTAQTSFTEQTLLAIDGSDGDLWAVGDGATVRHFDGLAWQTVPGPGVDDSFRAVAVRDDAVLVAGSIRLRRYDRSSGAWSVVGGPSLQAITGLSRLPDDRLLALGTGGRAFISDDGTSWSALVIPSDVTSTLRAASVTPDGRLVVVGEGGTLLVTTFAAGALGPLTRVASPTPLDLNALTVTSEDGDLLVVGDHGTAMSWPAGGVPYLQTIDDYRSEANGVFRDGDGRVRIVGSAAFILGPFLHFPTVTSPIHDVAPLGEGGELAFSWQWSTGPTNQYTQLRLIPEASIAVWTLIVEGDETTAVLPDLEAAAGISALPTGRIRFEVLRVLNRNFSIDEYTTREFSIYARDSWTTNEAWFYLP